MILWQQSHFYWVFSWFWEIYLWASHYGIDCGHVQSVKIAVGFGLGVVLPGVALFHFMMISSLRMGITLPQNWPICPIWRRARFHSSNFHFPHLTSIFNCLSLKLQFHWDQIFHLFFSFKTRRSCDKNIWWVGKYFDQFNQSSQDYPVLLSFYKD